MPSKIKAGGASCASVATEKLREILAKGGKQGHKARMELIKRGKLVADAQAGRDYPDPKL